MNRRTYKTKPKEYKGETDTQVVLVESNYYNQPEETGRQAGSPSSPVNQPQESTAGDSAPPKACPGPSSQTEYKQPPKSQPRELDNIRELLRNELEETMRRLLKDELPGLLREVIRDEINLKSSDTDSLYYNEEAIKRNRVQSFIKHTQTECNIAKENVDEALKSHKFIGEREDINEKTEHKKPIASPRTFHVPRMGDSGTTADEVKDNRPRLLRKHKSAAKADIRECYANALQSNLEKIVDVLEYRDSELPDFLIKDGNVTESESHLIRSLPDRKDQVRALFSLIKGRDESALKSLFDYIQDSLGDSELATNIREKFHKNKEDKLNSKMCIMCKIKKMVNVKYVIDGLSAQFIIDDGLYNDCLWTVKPTGAQEGLWGSIFDIFNSLKPQSFRKACETLVRILQEKNHYDHLATGLKLSLERSVDSFRCTCKMSILRQSSSIGSARTFTPRSSVSDKNRSHSPSICSDFEQEECNEQQHPTNEVHGARFDKDKTKEAASGQDRTLPVVRGKSDLPPLPFKRKSLVVEI